MLLKKIKLALAAVVLTACGSNNYITQEDFEARTTALEQQTEILRLCVDRRTLYEIAAYSCASQELHIEDYEEIIQAMARENAPAVDSYEYRQEVMQRARRAILRACDVACVYENHCQASETSSCDTLQQYITELAE